MSKYVINDTTLTAIGDAIREKNGTSDLIPVSGLADAITNLPSGGGGGGLSITKVSDNKGYSLTYNIDLSEYISKDFIFIGRHTYTNTEAYYGVFKYSAATKTVSSTELILDTYWYDLLSVSSTTKYRLKGTFDTGTGILSMSAYGSSYNLQAAWVISVG